jgi:nucleotide-binding universal stress UspA family protein
MVWRSGSGAARRTSRAGRGPEAALTNLAAARSQTAEYRQELALRLIERSLSSHRSDRRSDVALRIWDYLPHRPCRKRGRSRRILRGRTHHQNRSEGDDAEPEQAPGDPVEIATRVEKPSEKAIGGEAKKGYGLLFIGREPASEGDTFHEQITHSAAKFGGPFAIAIARGIDRQEMLGTQLNILVPVTGAAVSRQGAELAIALAQASQGSVTAPHVASGQRRAPLLATSCQRRTRSNEQGRSHHSRDCPTGRSLWVEVKGAVRSVRTPQEAILRQLDVGGHSLLVMGVSPRPGDQLFFGQLPAELLERAECSVLFVASEPPISAQSPEKSRDLAVQ